MAAQETPVLLRQQFPVVDGHLNPEQEKHCESIPKK